MSNDGLIWVGGYHIRLHENRDEVCFYPIE